MYITKVIIENHKIFKGKFVFEPNKGLNLLVGSNESGKPTIFESILLALAGMLNGRYLKNDLTQYLFNVEFENLFTCSVMRECKNKSEFEL